MSLAVALFETNKIHHGTGITYVGRCFRQVSGGKVAVVKSAVVACVQQLHAPDFHHEHGGPQHMARSVCTHLQAGLRV